MHKCFEDDKDVVCQIWQQYRVTDEELAEIVAMSNTDNSQNKCKDLATKYPNLDLLFFLKYAALCTANHYIEGTFSNQQSAFRINMSDTRLDRKMRYQQNVVHPMQKRVLTEAIARVRKKGCKAKHVTAVGTKEDCRLICRIKQDILKRECMNPNLLLIVTH